MNSLRQNAMDLTYGAWKSLALYAGVKLNIIEFLKSGHKSADEISKELSLDYDYAYRLLKILNSLDVLKEVCEGTFELTKIGEHFLEGHPESMKYMILLECSMEWISPKFQLAETVRQGKSGCFEKQFGMSPFDYLKKNQELGSVFNNAMSSYSRTINETLAKGLKEFDLTNAKTICDVGGGHGQFLFHVLQDNKEAKGILFELPSVIETFYNNFYNDLSSDLKNRCSFVKGNMFQEVTSSDVYILKYVCHNWGDAAYLRLLETLNKASHGKSKILIVESICKEDSINDYARVLDIHMMSMYSGKERTADEHSLLLEKGGWKLLKVKHTDLGIVSIIEAIQK